MYFGAEQPLNEVQARALVHDDERVLKLAGALGIQAEVGLQGNGEVYALGHVHERAAGPHRAVERRELVIVGRHELHEVLAHHVGIFALYGALHISVNHALGRHGILDVVIDKLGVVLRTHTGEGFSLRLRDAKALEGLLDVLRHVLPVVAHLGVRANVGRDMIHIKALNRRAPVGDLHFIVDLEGFEPELLHPHGIVLLLGELFDDDLRRQAGFHSVRVVFRVPNVVDTAVHILHVGFFLSNLPCQEPPDSVFLQAAESLFVDLIHQFGAAVADDDAVFHHVGCIHMERL